MLLMTASYPINTVEPFHFPPPPPSSSLSNRSKRQPSFVPLYEAHRIQFQVDDASALLSKWIDRYQSLTGNKWITTATGSTSSTTASEFTSSTTAAPIHPDPITVQKIIPQSNSDDCLHMDHPSSEPAKDGRLHRSEELNDSQSLVLEWTTRYMVHVERRVLDHTRGRLIVSI